MSNVIDLDRRPNADMPGLVDRFIQASGARLSDQIMIAGARNLDCLISLTRRGFARVICQSPERSPHVPNSRADVILAPAIANEAQLLDLLQHLGSALQPGGTVIIEAPTISHLAEETLRSALRAKDFVLEPVSDGLWRIHRQDQALVRAA
jgi:hypothetical protein